MILIVANNNIKGYHFRVKPNEMVKMKLLREEDNKYDEFVMIIQVPEVHEILSGLCEKSTNDRHHPSQKVHDICGKIVGCVPASLGKIFCQLLELDIEEILW